MLKSSLSVTPHGAEAQVDRDLNKVVAGAIAAHELIPKKNEHETMRIKFRRVQLRDESGASIMIGNKRAQATLKEGYTLH